MGFLEMGIRDRRDKINTEDSQIRIVGVDTHEIDSDVCLMMVTTSHPYV